MREERIAWPEPRGFNAAALTAEEKRIYRSGAWGSVPDAGIPGDGTEASDAAEATADAG